MRILILANDAEGLYKFRKELIQELIANGNKVYISLPEGKFIRNLEKLGCRFINTYVDRRGINPKTDAKLMLFYMRLIKKFHPDLVITYTIKPNIYGNMMSRFLRIPYAANITGLGTAFQKDGMVKKLVIFLYKVALKKAKVVFFENVENQKIMQDLGIVRKEQVCLLNGAGVNLDEYPFCEYPEDGKIRFLFIGRVMKEKGVNELFEAAERLKKERDNVFFDIVGPMEENYRKRIEELTEKGIIEYYGYQEDVKPFIKNCHCFVLPSYHEGMANTLLESAAMGRPLITSRIHGCLETVEDGKTGYLCRCKNAEELYTRMKQFLNLTHEERKIMGFDGRKRMVEKFDKKQVVETTIRKLKSRS